MIKNFHQTTAQAFPLVGFPLERICLSDSLSDSARAVTSINQSICGGRIIVEHAKETPRSRNSYNDRGGDIYGGRGGGYVGGRGGYGLDDRGSLNDRNRSKYGPASRTKYRLVVENVSSRTG